MTRKALVLVFVALLLIPVRGQQPGVQNPPPPPTKIPYPSQQKSPPVLVDQDDIVRITTNVVQIDAVVTKDGKHVTDLKLEDFEILEDGKPQPITNFSYIWTVPKPVERSENVAAASSSKEAAPVVPRVLKPDDPHRTIAIVVDDLGISLESMGPVRKQLRKFIEQERRADDLVAIIRTGGEIGALQQFTTDKRLLLRAVESLRWNHCSRVGISVLTPVGSPDSAGLCSDPARPLGGTLDALRFILQGMRKMPGRKSMVILADNMPLDIPDKYLERGPLRQTIPTADTGVSESDSGLPESQFGNEAALRRIAELAIRSSVVIYGADTSGLQPLGPFAYDDPASVNLRPTGSQPFSILRNRANILFDNRAGLELVTSKTGGFTVKNSNDFGLKRVAQDQEGYYLIGYRPSENTFNRRFHSIKVRVKRSGLKVRTRSGFFGMTDEEAWPLQYTGRDQVLIALMSPFGASEIEVHLTAMFANIPQRGSFIRSLVHFPVGALTFTDEPGGWHKSTINLSCVVFGDNGRVIESVMETRDIRLDEANFKKVVRDGLTYRFDVPVKTAGAYQFRVAVRDGRSARIGTAREFIDVPELKKNRLALSGITVSGDTGNNNSMTNPSAPSSTSGDPAVRRFRLGSNLLFGYVIYKARLDKRTHLPTLSSQTRIFRDGKLVYSGDAKIVDVASQNDLERITAGGGVQLGLPLEPGEYVLQILVTDPLADEKHRTASQWIDFRIVK